MEHLSLQTEDLLLGHGRLPRDVRVLAVESMRPVPLAPEHLEGLAGPAGELLGGVGGERYLYFVGYVFSSRSNSRL